MRKKVKILFTSFIFLFLTYACQNQKEKSLPIEFVTQDVANFYDMLSRFRKADSLGDTIKILNEYYLDKASIGLKDYLNSETKNNKRDIEKEYLNIIRSFPKYFQSQKSLISDVKNHLKGYEEYFQKIKEVYPEAKFQPTYYSIGFFNTQGQMIYPKTVFIGLEASLRNNSTNYGEFPESYSWLQEDSLTYKNLGYIVVHEHLHTLQKAKPDDNSILSRAITEGAAVFLTEHFCGKESLIGSGGIGQNMIDYAKKNEKNIWEDFINDLVKPENFSKWFWNSDSKYPFSMGYYMGYMICKSFYENQKDKKNAIKNLIEITDPTFIFEQSQFYKNSQK
jgi:hypothetical protein